MSSLHLYSTLPPPLPTGVYRIIITMFLACLLFVVVVGRGLTESPTHRQCACSSTGEIACA